MNKIEIVDVTKEEFSNIMLYWNTPEIMRWFLDRAIHQANAEDINWDAAKHCSGLADRLGRIRDATRIDVKSAYFSRELAVKVMNEANLKFTCKEVGIDEPREPV